MHGIWWKFLYQTWTFHAFLGPGYKEVGLPYCPCYPVTRTTLTRDHFLFLSRRIYKQAGLNHPVHPIFLEFRVSFAPVNALAKDNSLARVNFAASRINPKNLTLFRFITLDHANITINSSLKHAFLMFQGPAPLSK